MNKVPDQQIFRQADTLDAGLFCPEATGEWAEDNRLGREAALDLAEYVKRTNDMPMVGQVMESMYASRPGKPDGVKAGFTCALAALLAQ